MSACPLRPSEHFWLHGDGKTNLKANLQLIGPQSVSLQVALVFADLAATLP